MAVTDFMTVERYSHVLHLVSQVDGTLRDGLDALDAFRATFPAGTMTGAPKVRAMEIIDELEPERRGAVRRGGGLHRAPAARGWTSRSRSAPACSPTAWRRSRRGPESSHDSVPASEWAETENKARAMLTAIGQVRDAARRHSTADTPT